MPDYKLQCCPLEAPSLLDPFSNLEDDGENITQESGEVSDDFVWAESGGSKVVATDALVVAVKDRQESIIVADQHWSGPEVFSLWSHWNKMKTLVRVRSPQFLG